MNETTEELVKEEWNNTLTYLKESSVQEIIDGTLEINREQTSTGSGWITNEYILVLTTGGPHIEVSTNGRLSVSWSDRYADQVTGDVRDKLDRVHERLEDIYVG